MSRSIPIPASSRIAIPGRDGEFFEARDLATTPNGTVYGVTPGGSRIVYDRETLLALRNSPLAQTPPKNMAKIPGVTVPPLEGSPKGAAAVAQPKAAKPPKPEAASAKGPVFNMEDDD